MRDKLAKIFKKNFNTNLDKIDSISMKNTEKWDSFTHINLLINNLKIFLYLYHSSSSNQLYSNFHKNH